MSNINVHVDEIYQKKSQFWLDGMKILEILYPTSLGFHRYS